MKKIIFLTLLVLSLKINGGRPVFHSLSRTDLINESSLIISGWPTVQKTINQCSTTIGSWYVHKVHKGDKKFEGQNIMIADHQYKLIEESQKVGKGVSYKSQIYSQKGIDKEQSTSFLFLNIDKTGCAELSAVGAQEHRFNENQIEAMLSVDCSVIERGFDSYLYRIPNKCQKDEDCKNHYLHPDSCHAPYIGSSELGEFLDAEFLALKSRFQSFCEKNWKGEAVCSPQVLSMVCKKEKCEHGVSELKLSSAPKLNLAKISFGCAPHDALSTMIYLKPEKSDYPTLSINWWGKNRLSNTKGHFQLKATNFKESNARQDFTARYCHSLGNCFYLKEIEMKFEVFEDKNSGKLDYKFILENNLKLEGTLPLEFIKSNQQILCG